MNMARILVIDDDETFSYVLKRACSRQGHEVMLSASACEAKEASAGMFDIVFWTSACRTATACPSFPCS